MSKKTLVALLEKIDTFDVAPATERQSDIHLDARFPYKFALLKCICIAWGSKELVNLKEGKIEPRELMPWFHMVLVTDFLNRLQNKSDVIAQPLWRMAVTDKFWKAIDNNGSVIDISNYQKKQEKNKVKTITSFKKIVDHCCLPDDLKSVLNNNFERTVLYSFLSAKLEECKPT